tara:strand:- start:1171 stop:1425 length:255 start_codon:yes stop_codon:yes gene_type:complete
MSNIFTSSFTPGKRADGSKFSSDKVDSMFNPTFQPKVSKAFAHSYNTIRTLNKNNNLYKRKGKPVKPNTGSMDRLNKIKAKAMK